MPASILATVVLKGLEATLIHRLSRLRCNYRHDNNNLRMLRISNAYRLSYPLGDLHVSNKGHASVVIGITYDRLNMALYA